MNTGSNFWFVFGLSTFSFMLGCLIGVSQSPVVGVFLSGILGLGVGFGGTLFKRGSSDGVQKSNINVNTTGKYLFILSFFVLFGAYSGSSFRSSLYPDYDIIWTSGNEPKSTYEALDWIRVNEILINKGYSKSEIREIYNLRLKYREDEDHYSDGIDFPFFYKILIDGDNIPEYEPKGTVKNPRYF